MKLEDYNPPYMSEAQKAFMQATWPMLQNQAINGATTKEQVEAVLAMVSSVQSVWAQAIAADPSLFAESVQVFNQLSYDANEAIHAIFNGNSE